MGSASAVAGVSLADEVLEDEPDERAERPPFFVGDGLQLVSQVVAEPHVDALAHDHNRTALYRNAQHISPTVVNRAGSAGNVSASRGSVSAVRQTTIKLDPELDERARRYCAADGNRSLASLVRTALDAYLTEAGVPATQGASNR